MTISLHLWLTLIDNERDNKYTALYKMRMYGNEFIYLFFYQYEYNKTNLPLLWRLRDLNEYKSSNENKSEISWTKCINLSRTLHLLECFTITVYTWTTTQQSTIGQLVSLVCEISCLWRISFDAESILRPTYLKICRTNLTFPQRNCHTSTTRP